jgi:hypothetical protein
MASWACHFSSQLVRKNGADQYQCLIGWKNYILVGKPVSWLLALW